VKIVICGSMSFAKKMLEAKEFLEKQGHECFVPREIESQIIDNWEDEGGSVVAQREIKHNFIKRHYVRIKGSDAILVLNYDKDNVQNYIGGNTFLRIGFACILGKKIFLLNKIPNIKLIKQELEIMRPVILNGDLSRI